MILVKVMKLSKNGLFEEMTMKFKGTKEEYLEIEKLAGLAEDCYIDQLESWK